MQLLVFNQLQIIEKKSFTTDISSKIAKSLKVLEVTL